jgi:exonuclease III
MEINLVAQFCRALHGKRGVAIYVHNSPKFTTTDLRKYCKEKKIEICAVKLNLGSTAMCIISLYRSPLGSFNYFLQILNNVLQSLYTAVSHIIICDDININYLVENEQRTKLDDI